MSRDETTSDAVAQQLASLAAAVRDLAAKVDRQEKSLAKGVREGSNAILDTLDDHAAKLDELSTTLRRWGDTDFVRVVTSNARASFLGTTRAPSEGRMWTLVADPNPDHPDEPPVLFDVKGTWDGTGMYPNHVRCVGLRVSDETAADIRGLIADAQSHEGVTWVPADNVADVTATSSPDLEPEFAIFHHPARAARPVILPMRMTRM